MRLSFCDCTTGIAHADVPDLVNTKGATYETWRLEGFKFTAIETQQLPGLAAVLNSASLQP
jgi:hypothetical protein